MLEILSWLFFIVFIAGLVVVGGLLVRGYLTNPAMTGPSFGMNLFPQKPEKRLDVVEQTSIDGRRKLLLIRRDNVEHLIMTGGPVDVLVETGIDTTKELREAASAAIPEQTPIAKAQSNLAAPAFSRAPRRLTPAASGE